MAALMLNIYFQCEEAPIGSYIDVVVVRPFENDILLLRK
jgi:hypothetical protein